MDMKHIAVIALLLSGCNMGSSQQDNLSVAHDGKDMAVNFAVPKVLAKLPGDVILLAEATIDGTTTTKLTVNLDETVSGEIHNVPAGTHQLVITYFVYQFSVRVDLAVAISEITVIANQTTEVMLSDSDLNRDIDDDLDGYTNLAEIRMGTLAYNASDTPDGESPMYVVSNGSFGQAQSNSYHIKYTLGEAVNGSSESINYAINSGYSSY